MYIQYIHMYVYTAYSRLPRQSWAIQQAAHCAHSACCESHPSHEILPRVAHDDIFDSWINEESHVGQTQPKKGQLLNSKANILDIQYRT